MKRYIDANLAQKIADTELDLEQAGVVQYVLSHTPTVDPEDLIPKGKWEQGVCTNCGFDIRCLTDGENDLEQWVWEEGFDHCPNCGSDNRDGVKME